MLLNIFNIFTFRESVISLIFGVMRCFSYNFKLLYVGLKNCYVLYYDGDIANVFY